MKLVICVFLLFFGVELSATPEIDELSETPQKTVDTVLVSFSVHCGSFTCDTIKTYQFKIFQNKFMKSLKETDNIPVFLTSKQYNWFMKWMEKEMKPETSLEKEK